MSHLCSTPKCKRNSRAPCDCCDQSLCLQHLYEHNILLVSQSNPLTHEINKLGDQLNTLNFRGTSRNCREKLEEWRSDCHQKIDHFFEQKCHELDRLVAAKIDEQRQNFLRIQTKLAKLIREQEATQQDIDTLTSTICQLEKEINKIDQACFHVNTRPLLIDDSRVQFKETYIHELNSSTLSTVYKAIVYPKRRSYVLASNDRLLLTYQAPNLCFLDTELILVKQIVWAHGTIGDTCWSSTLDRFIVTTKDTVFLVDENTMSIERVQTIGKPQWLSCTCSNAQLFLSTNTWGSSIVEISLSPSLAIIQEWKSPRTCTMDECIDDIVYNNGTLAVMINNTVEKSMRMELRTCKALDRLWSLVLDGVYNKDITFRCCSLNYNGWLVADFNARCLLNITTDGKMKEAITYKAIPYRITLFTPDMVVVSTKSSINLHKI